MNHAEIIASLRKRAPLLACLPHLIVVPPIGRREDAVTQVIADATVDDIALAVHAIKLEFDRIGDRLYALRALHDLARQAGALGADRAVPAVLAMPEGR